MPKVSIIMSVYNCSDTLNRCIDSILNQTYADWEFVICDDCSIDNTYNILLEYKEKYGDKFVLLKNEINSRLAYSLNKCLSVAKGEYIARMDGDDESFPERLEKQVRFLDTHLDYDVVGTAMVPFDENGDKRERLSKPVPNARDLLNGPPFCHATIMMRKEAYDAVGGYTVSARTQRAQDYDMWFRFFAKGFKGYNLQEGLYHVLEDSAAYKRRTFKTRLYEVQTKLIGYKLLKYPFYLYLFAFKPIVVAMIPNGILRKIYK